MYHQRTDSERESIYRRYIELKADYPNLRMGMGKLAINYIMKWGKRK